MKDRKDLAMHIVILDGGSTNPGDVSWAPLRALGSVTVYDTPLSPKKSWSAQRTPKLLS